MKQLFLSIWEVLEIALIALATVFLIRTFLVQPFLVSGASMEPSFSDGNYLLVDELTYRFREPERGEIIVFESPTGDSYFIKRVIGLPGERVQIKQGIITVTANNNQLIALKESYLLPGTKTAGDVELVLKDGQYFVLGDNRGYSFDSRSWGSLEAEKIIGLVRLRLWPINKVMAFEAPVY